MDIFRIRGSRCWRCPDSRIIFSILVFCYLFTFWALEEFKHQIALISNWINNKIYLLGEKLWTYYVMYLPFSEMFSFSFLNILFFVILNRRLLLQSNCEVLSALYRIYITSDCMNNSIQQIATISTNNHEMFWQWGMQKVFPSSMILCHA